MSAEIVQIHEGDVGGSADGGFHSSPAVLMRVRRAVAVLAGRELPEAGGRTVQDLKAKVWFLEMAAADADRRVSEAEGQAESLVEELASIEDDLIEKSSQASMLEGRCAALTAATPRRCDQSAVIRDLPKTATEVVDTIEKLFDGRVVFTDRARVRARGLKGKGRRYVDALWSCLHALGGELLDLPAGELERAFENRTGFGLSLTEGKMTKSDSRLMRLRLDEYDGVAIDITPHVKARVGRERLRVYFAVDRTNERIIVGHVGEHLDTYESRFLH